ncbi:Lrp/AsnC family transcriptional regulator [Candidatus Woesearchaeota archaeon]|jgi:DNA-binding Lrp family transcriptional regulator|nr:Lrp/AsnC family transcriptional regulator [Candidatus Woesearchaeota archaeon]MBT6520110.1 Lrp/AsnC family transcriptional regulator [Candidatus Woesearchaeota archaeon]MBT7366715.1 Lrp/AsnC family transcriptional regulator [Candidatus Woesearchaeota archaeon]
MIQKINSSYELNNNFIKQDLASKTNLSIKSLKLLSSLRENSREKLTSISKTTNIPVSTLFDILKELQHSTITKSTVLLNFSKLGYHTRAQVFIKLKNDSATNTNNRDELVQHLNCNHSVNNIYKINNGWDFIIETVHKNIRELDECLDNLNKRFGIQKQEIHYLIDDIKREGFSVGANFA